MLYRRLALGFLSQQVFYVLQTMATDIDWLMLELELIDVEHYFYRRRKKNVQLEMWWYQADRTQLLKWSYISGEATA